jgi:hypothetical protein
VYYNSGQSATTPVDELFYSGVGMAQDVLDPAFGVTPGTHQQDIDRSIDAYFRLHPVTQIRNVFTLTDDAGGVLGQATAAVTVVPEPSGFGALIALAAGSRLLRRRRKRAAAVVVS